MIKPAVRLLLISLVAAALQAQSVSYMYDSAGRLTGATYTNGKVLNYSYDPAGNLLRTLVISPVAGVAPAFTVGGATNSGSYIGGGVSPGELVTIFGTGLGPATLATEHVTPLGFFDNYLAETSVLFDGVPAALVYVSAMQTTAIVPYSVQGRATTQVVAQYQGRSSASVSLPVAATAPGLFSADGSGKGNGAILNQDASVNGPGNPAAKGSVIVLYGTGEGQTTPRGVDGRIAVGVYPKPLLPVTVTIGGTDTEVLYAGAAPGLVTGVFQINARVPAGAASGPVSVVVKVGPASSQQGITVAVQ